MSEQQVPRLGQPTDAQDVEDEIDIDDHADTTIETPDELGGTGGEQAGGAG